MVCCFLGGGQYPFETKPSVEPTEDAHPAARITIGAWPAKFGGALSLGKRSILCAGPFHWFHIRKCLPVFVPPEQQIQMRASLKHEPVHLCVLNQQKAMVLVLLVHFFIRWKGVLDLGYTSSNFKIAPTTPPCRCQAIIPQNNKIACTSTSTSLSDKATKSSGKDAFLGFTIMK